jgi:2,4-dienoyl-CoA reductase-like NADH-dependent reductase (Old Yellow Enzyme family)
MSHLFSPLPLRSITLKNRIAMSPMCQYSCEAGDGKVSDWHLLHYPTRALGGVGLVMVEASAIEARGRISPQDLGIWSDEQLPGLRELAGQVKAAGAVAAIQLAHAGRKAGTARPWEGGKPLHTWTPVAPSPIPFTDGYMVPHELDGEGLKQIRTAFVEGALRAKEAGFQVIELHMAHGYLLNSFLSPVSNKRNDAYGGNQENRMRFPLEVVEAVRRVWPEELPLLVRVSATDWLEGGWTIEDTVVFARALMERGVDLLDCSSGGIAPGARIPVGPGYQVPLAQQVRRETGMKTGAVGLITEALQAETLLASGQANLVFLARALLAEPYWALKAAKTLGEKEKIWPRQYDRAFV